ncbi:hypothetical protein A3D80_02775 [Candidatus Roizmanbacteria bacterium RIFCSPHIGHO2_02_FULL_40_13b]|nr:MAG: hypothetical protein A3D80_02775 [Candidatus Roizmanbacteria bacterium RIFCSPHIGHO2_02_FULL_40_13b]
MKKLNLNPGWFVIFAVLLWSLDGILRRSLFSLPPAIIVFWEHALGALVLTPFVLKRRAEFTLLTAREWTAVAIISLFSGALGTIFYTAALGQINFIQFSVVVLLQQLQPIWAIGTAAIILKEKLPAKFLMWAIVGIAASYVVTFPNLTVNLETGQGTIIAAGFALLAGILWGSSTSFSKIVLKKTSYIATTYLRFLIAPIFAAMIFVGLGQSDKLLTISQPQLTTLLIITFSTGMVALLIYYYGLRKIPVRVSAILELFWPLSAVVIDYFLFKKMLSVTQIIGAAILIYSMYRVSRYSKDEVV